MKNAPYVIPPQEVQALLDFAVASLKNRTAREKAARVITRIVRICEYGSHQPLTARDISVPPDYSPGLKAEALALVNRIASGIVGSTSVFEEQHVLGVQKEWRRILDALLAYESFDVDAPQCHRFVAIQPASGPIAIRRYAVHPKDHRGRVRRFTGAIVPLLRQHGHRIRRCAAPDCDRVFYADKSHKRQCSERCRRRRADTAWMERNRDKLVEVNHAKYVRRKKRQFAKQAVKVAKRARRK